MGSAFFVLSILPEIIDNLGFSYLNKIHNNLQNIDSINRTAPILKIPGLTEFCDYCFKNHACKNKKKLIK